MNEVISEKFPDLTEKLAGLGELAYNLWWIEGFNGRNGWAYGRTAVDGDRDPADAEEIYQILENEIIPLYYKFSDDGIPYGWVRVMKESIKNCGQKLSARRMVNEYVQKYYATAIKAAEI